MGPTLPISNPLNLLAGKYNLLDILTSSSPKEFAAFPKIDIDAVRSSKYS